MPVIPGAWADIIDRFRSKQRFYEKPAPTNIIRQDLDHLSSDQSKFSAFDLARSSQDNTASLASAASEQVHFTPPAGEMWDFLWLYFSVANPPGAASGTHSTSISVLSLTGASVIDITVGDSTFADALVLQFNEWTATVSSLPSTPEAVILQIHKAKATPTYPVRFTYINSTDVAQTNTRYYRAGYRKTQI